MEEFITIKENVSFELVEKKSKFIANLIPVNNKEEAEEKLKEIRKKYFDARHNCFCYRIIDNEEKIIERASDDGEPSGTAGDPMLNILRKNNLANVLIIVTRYFGGILLGTGGLVRAYSDATINAINIAKKQVMVLGYEMEVIINYSDSEKFKYYCKKNCINITDAKYEQNIVCKITLEEEKKERLFKDYETKKINLAFLKLLDKKIIVKCI